MLGLLGFGGGMDFDSDKAYRYYRDRFSNLKILKWAKRMTEFSQFSCIFYHC